MDASKDFVKIAGKNVLHKSAEATGEMIGNKVADRITKSSRNKAQKEDDRTMEETYIKWNTITLIIYYVLKK